MLRRLLSLFPVILVLVTVVRGQAAQAPAAAPTLAIDGLGKGVAPVAGPWQFHIGDNLGWAQPQIDDATGQEGWESIATDKPWGAQGHFGYTGFGWYRRHLTLTPAENVKPDFRLFLPAVDSACEVYWNGSLIGRIGKLPPDPSWPAVLRSGNFSLPAAGTGVLALRVWKAPLGSGDSGSQGGIVGTPLVGSAESIAGRIAMDKETLSRATLYMNALNLIRFLIACAAFIAWLRQRRETVFLWFAVFAASPPLWSALFNPGSTIPFVFASATLQPLFALFNIALWYLLVHLLEL
ncbi:MAG: GGDEF domain-containing protein, partial [Acidobacteriota bacterium]